MILGDTLQFENADAGYWVSIDAETKQYDGFFEINHKGSAYIKPEHREDVYEATFQGNWIGNFNTLEDAIGACRNQDIPEQVLRDC